MPLAIDKAEYGVVDLNNRDKLPECYACEFKGNTAIRVAPIVQADARPNADPRVRYRLFRRDALGGSESPMKQASAYIHPAKLVDWRVE